MATVLFPARQGEITRQVECAWVSPPGQSEIAHLRSWFSGSGNQAQIDAGELAVLAAMKWGATCKLGTVANSLADMEAKIRKNSEAEVTAMFMAHAEWSRSRALGVCLIHRTWTNNVYLDFLAAHPGTMDPATRVSGIGTGLLYCLCELASRLKAPTLWIETTPGSAAFYCSVFRLPAANDMLGVSRADQDGFCFRVRMKWGIPERLDSPPA